MRRLFLLLLVMLSLLIIPACVPFEYSYFGNSTKAAYSINIDYNMTATTNLTFYYDTDKQQNNIRIRLPPKAELLYLGDEFGKIEDYAFMKIIKDGKRMTNKQDILLKTHYSPSGNRGVSIIYSIPLQSANKVYLNYSLPSFGVVIQTFENPFIQKMAVSALWDSHGVKKNFEIYFPPDFYPRSAKVELVGGDVDNVVDAEISKDVVTFFTDQQIKSFDVEFLGNIKNHSNLKRGETKHYSIISEYAEVQWFNEKVEPYYSVISNFTGLVSKYDKHLTIIDSSPPDPNVNVSIKISYPLSDGGIFLAGLITSELVIHETAHVYLEFLEKFKNVSWFNEGSATYTQKFMVSYDLKFISYDELKKLYSDGFTFKKEWFSGDDPAKYVPLKNYYSYSAFIIDAYVEEYGIEALQNVYKRLKDLSEECGINSECSHDDIIRIMIEESGTNITEDDILYPHKNLFFKDKNVFLKKIEFIVQDVYCYQDDNCIAPE